jgi:formate hydrogenlyase subunit 4
VALVESTIAKMRFYRVQEFLTGAFFMALTGLSLALLSQLL